MKVGRGVLVLLIVWMVLMGCEKGSAPESSKPAPKETSEADKMIKEWVRFRQNEDAYRGTTVTWKFKVSYFSKENPIGYLGGNSDYCVCVQSAGITYQADVMCGRFPRVKEEDWIVVTGTLAYVSADNVVVLRPTHVENEGYK